jgi:hypothetical protein
MNANPNNTYSAGTGWADDPTPLFWTADENNRLGVYYLTGTNPTAKSPEYLAARRTFAFTGPLSFLALCLAGESPFFLFLAVLLGLAALVAIIAMIAAPKPWVAYGQAIAHAQQVNAQRERAEYLAQFTPFEREQILRGERMEAHAAAQAEYARRTYNEVRYANDHHTHYHDNDFFRHRY